MLLLSTSDDYRAHISCVTEAERYEKRTPAKNNGKISPQQQWMDLIQNSVSGAPDSIRSYMTSMARLDNVPRKEKQFRNFTANSLNLRGNRNGAAIVDDIWKYLQQLREKQQKEKEELAATSTSPKATKVCESIASKMAESKDSTKGEDSMQECSSRKRACNHIDDNAKLVATREVTSLCSGANTEHTNKVNDIAKSKLKKKDVKKAMKKALKGAKNNTLSKKELRKAVSHHLGMPNSSHTELKELIKGSLNSSKRQSFLVNGSLITLKVN